MRTWFSNITTGILTLCALIVTGLVVKREFSTRPRTGDADRVQAAPNGWESLAAGGTVVGSGGAPVRIIVFSDFECPFCARARVQLEEILVANPRQVAVAYYHFPIASIHPHALAAAMAAECADEQGMFREYHDALFQMQDSLGVKPWGAFAQSVGVPDLSAFHRCVADERYRERIQHDLELGRRFGVRGSPTMIVDGRKLTGYDEDGVIGAWVEAALRRSAGMGLGGNEKRSTP